MLKPLTTKFKGREITLECTHKKVFPPPQMYGATPEDIDTLWKQGVIDQNQHQHLTVWAEKCGLMVMGPKCLDCPLALKQNPRPGRPHVIETENWLEAKNRIHWEDMKNGKFAAQGAAVEPVEDEGPEEPELDEEDAPEEPEQEEPAEEEPDPDFEVVLSKEEPASQEISEKETSSVQEETHEDPSGLSEDLLNALAED